MRLDVRTSILKSLDDWTLFVLRARIKDKNFKSWMDMYIDSMVDSTQRAFTAADKRTFLSVGGVSARHSSQFRLPLVSVGK